MGNLRTRSKYFEGQQKESLGRSMSIETLQVLIDIRDILTDIRDKMTTVPLIAHSVSMPFQDQETVELDDDIPSFIPTIETDDLKVQANAVETKTRTRNLSGAASALKDLKEGDDNE